MGQIAPLWADDELWWQAIIGALIMAVVAYLHARTQAIVKASEKVTTAAAQKAVVVAADTKAAAVEAATTTAQAIEQVKQVAEGTHRLVNGSMGAQLQINAAVCARLAEMTGKPGDQEAAKRAERLLREHEQREATEVAIAKEQPAAKDPQK